MLTNARQSLGSLSLAALVLGASVGATAMCLFDPARGAARRARLRDQLGHLARRSWRFGAAAKVDLANRGYGLAARLAGPLREPHLDDEVLVARIRAALGRIVTHPGSVHVMIDNGAVRLDGPVLPAELQPVLTTVKRITGETPIRNGLSVRSEGSSVPGLQSTGTLPPLRLRHQLRSLGIQAAIGLVVCGIAVLAATKLVDSRSGDRSTWPSLPA
jgi:hypothetical protein